ncbi:ABC transporter ATP-binding protein [uncultured Fusobacterium sp.]|uniref:ABC transporter ATP-binding protein n=1 Tax=uncultured Fusobacterium sp. TaxID=159267 RepID=UPI0025DA5C20|nr:ABC transporter ATP-binding protein [uncultured Fusobacterium sp.]
MSDFNLEVKNLTYKIINRDILKNINFQIKKGEIVGIIGPNGSGKTTLLKTLNGINEEIQGEIRWNGKKIKEYSKKELARHIAFMNQNTNVGFDFPCIDVVVLGRYPYLERFEEYSKDDIKKAEFYMEKTNTLKFKNRMITELSGGERQRVLFAKILTQESDLILLDEPTASLDMKYEEEIFSIISNLKEQNKSIIAVIHNLRVAIKYCTRLILLFNGEIVADDIPENVITEENLKNIYGVETKVYKNQYNQELDFCIL